MIDPPLVAAADELLTFLRTLGRPACLIGGMVVARWGEPRQTRDVDRIRLWGGRFGEILDRPELLEPFESALLKPGRLR